VEVLEYAMAEMGRSRKELAEILGSSARASEIMNRKRLLTRTMIEKISRAWHIPYAALAKPYRLATAAGAERGQARTQPR
ncbi:MAG TPA: XRE family transcriptional regulator, partial [Beijerinckiaceae bacterium]|nr:XRE family transcriptional regulator [Beijerinckiaceae bacterium]